MLYYVYVFDPLIDKLPIIHLPRRSNIAFFIKRAPVYSFNNLCWHILSNFTYYRYGIIDVDTRVELSYTHTTINLFHMQFVKRLGGGILISPDATIPEERCKGLHPYLLYKVMEFNMYKKKKFFTYVKIDNIASIKGIEKVGFRHCGYTVQYNHIQYLTDENGMCI